MVSYKFRRWILLFSHSGSEAAALVEGLYEQRPGMNIEPRTNNLDINSTPTWPIELVYDDYHGSGPANVFTHPGRSKAPEIHAYLKTVDEPTLITLHGYNRIIPSDVLANPSLEIYNLHPGDCLTHPQLVGKDPQEKAIALNLPSTGVMLHRVTEDLDGGPLYGFIRRDIKKETTLPTLVADLKEDALNLWFPFIIGKLNEIE